MRAGEEGEPVLLLKCTSGVVQQLRHHVGERAILASGMQQVWGDAGYVGVERPEHHAPCWR